MSIPQYPSQYPSSATAFSPGKPFIARPIALNVPDGSFQRQNSTIDSQKKPGFFSKLFSFKGMGIITAVTMGIAYGIGMLRGGIKNPLKFSEILNSFRNVFKKATETVASSHAPSAPPVNKKVLKQIKKAENEVIQQGRKEAAATARNRAAAKNLASNQKDVNYGKSLEKLFEEEVDYSENLKNIFNENKAPRNSTQKEVDYSEDLKEMFKEKSKHTQAEELLLTQCRARNEEYFFKVEEKLKKEEFKNLDGSSKLTNEIKEKFKEKLKEQFDLDSKEFSEMASRIKTLNPEAQAAFHKFKRANYKLKDRIIRDAITKQDLNSAAEFKQIVNSAPVQNLLKKVHVAGENFQTLVIDPLKAS